MNVVLERAENTIRAHTSGGRDTTVYRNPESTKVQTGNFALDISGTVMDNSAYAGHGRAAEEVMQGAEQDLTARRNYMAVMSNSMSDEDFARLQKEGFHPGSTEIETVVTIVDRIKTALVKGGMEITGYTDTLSAEELESITGSRGLANALVRQFEKADIPLTQENAEAVMEAYRKMEEVQDFSEGSMKYMIENDLEPTAKNLYLSRFAGAGDSSRQGRGYFAEGAVAGYYARKPEEIDYDRLMPGIKKVIEEAGFGVSEETLRDAKWLIEKGIPLNTDTFSRLEQLSGLSFPVSEEDFVKSAAAAIADGIRPDNADISRQQSFLEQAVILEERVQKLDVRTADIILARNLPFHLKNLFAAQEALQNGQNAADAAKEKRLESQQENQQKNLQENPQGTQQGSLQQSLPENLQGRRLLEEVRLSMTISANLRLLRSGFQIETAPMEALIDKLKAAETAVDKALMQETDAGAAKEKSGLYKQTLFTLESIRTTPAAVAAKVSEEDNLKEIEAKGKALEISYKKAGESYEALMTAPRKDMGDSIKKAFRNVDGILSDLNQELTEENRKTVRILGYNSMEMTEKNFERIRQSKNLLNRVVNQMKPGTVLSMIREGVNPLAMSLEELDQYLSKKEEPVTQELESYSRFLHKLDRRNDISAEERSAFIGIYRLLRQIEKGDDAAVGAVVQGGYKESLENLLTAVRSSKKKHMDYQVGDAFGIIKAKASDVESITSQIEKGYIKTRENLEAALEEEESAGTKESAKAFEHTLFEDIRNAAGSEENVLRQLMNYEQPLTADYLMAAGEMKKNQGAVFGKLTELLGEQEKAGEKEFLHQLTGKEAAQKSYETLSDGWQQAVESAAFAEENVMDIKAMSMLYKQIVFMKSMAREENYTVPVEIGGEMTAVNLKMIHKNGEESKVSISLETELLGKNAAEFTFTKAGLSGYSICSSISGKKLLSEKEGVLKEFLAKEEISAGNIHFATEGSLNLEEFSLKISKDRISGQASDTYYKAAKAYIGFIQEITRKGSTEI